MFAVGLTGGIGSGKSHVAALFAHHGVAIVDSDAIAHALTAPGGEAMPAIRAAFGDALITSDGRLDRAAMRARVFDDPAARKQLEAILHPMIRERADAEARAAHGAPYVIFVVPLLVESGHWRGRLDRVLVIDCDEADQIARVVARNGLAPAQVRAIIATQAARDARLAVADDVIDNGEPLRDLHAEVAALHARYLALARDKATRTGPR